MPLQDQVASALRRLIWVCEEAAREFNAAAAASTDLKSRITLRDVAIQRAQFAEDLKKLLPSTVPAAPSEPGSLSPRTTTFYKATGFEHVATGIYREVLDLELSPSLRAVLLDQWSDVTRMQQTLLNLPGTPGGGGPEV